MNVRWPVVFLAATLVAIFFASVEAMAEVYVAVELLKALFSLDVQVGG